MTGPTKCVDCGQRAPKGAGRRPLCGKCKHNHHPWAKTKAIIKAERRLASARQKGAT